MRAYPRLFLFLGAVFALFLFAIPGNEALAQSTARNETGKTVGSAQLSQAELQEAYRSLQEQLRATQRAITYNRLETEANTRAQAKTLTERIDAMNATLAAERRSRQEESDRAEFARQQQQAEIQRSNRSVVWIATAFGAIGLMAMLFAAQFQWRAINRMAQVIDERPQLLAPADYGLPMSDTGSFADQSLHQSSQRLLSAIDRMELRIKELEPTVVQPLPTPRQPTFGPNA